MSGRPIRGLPERLPAGETLLWQGSPSWRSAALHMFHLRKAAVYFGILLAWLLAASLWNGSSIADVFRSFAIAAPLAIAALAILGSVAWLTCRTTVYSITNRRVVMQIGMALPMSVNIPFGIVESADVRTYPDSTGDITLRISGENRLAYLVLWPHARAWHLARPEPALRAIADAPRVADILARSLAAAAGQAVQPTVGAPERRARPAVAPEPGVAAAG